MDEKQLLVDFETQADGAVATWRTTVNQLYQVLYTFFSHSQYSRKQAIMVLKNTSTYVKQLRQTKGLWQAH